MFSRQRCRGAVVHAVTRFRSWESPDDSGPGQGAMAKFPEVLVNYPAAGLRAERLFDAGPKQRDSIDTRSS